MGNITHAFTNLHADGSDTSLVRPSDWNAAHTIPTTLEIVGPVASSTTPGIVFKFSSDADAALGYLCYDHDNIALIFDAYWNGAAWVASNPTSFSFYKVSGALKVGYTNGGTKGSVLNGPGSGFNLDGVAFKSDGTITLGKLGAFAAGDKYLIVDASGNVHKSGIGPVS
jgi:hypothetical protein